jgi:TPR repeat protein
MRGPLIGLLFAGTSIIASCGTQTYPIFPAETTARNTKLYDAAFVSQEGVGAPRDYARAVKLYAEASKFGDARAENNLGVMAMKGQGSVVNYSTAASHFRKAAKMGSASAHFNLGLLQDTGVGLPHNPAGAVLEYRMAAEMGLKQAQYRLAVMFEYGIGIDPSPAEAKRLYSLAAVRGMDEAYGKLASLDGKAIQDEEVVRSLLAADNCDDCATPAETGMAQRDYNGLVELAARGDAPARYNLAIRLLNGDHAPQDPSEAARLLTLAARQGYAPAQRQLAQMHLRGQAVVRSKVLAHAWLNLASKGGGAEAVEAGRQMDELEISMTVAEIKEAQNIAAAGADKGR